MTDATAGETPVEPEVTAVAPVLDEVPGEVTPPDPADVDGDAPSPEAASADAPAERALPFDVDHLGPLRRAVLDALADADEPLSVARIIAELPAGTSRGSAESAIRREWEADRIERVGAGLYVLAKPKPPKSPKRQSASPPPPPADEAMWFARLEAWATDSSSWDVEAFGPLPNVPNNIPPGIKAKFSDRLRKRRERYREAEAAATARATADAALRDQLIAATGGNVIRGPGIEDVTPIKLALELVPLDRVLSSIRSKTHKKLFPGNGPAASWREERLLREIAESYCRTMIVPNLVSAWAAAGKTPAKATEKPNAAPAVQVPTEPGDAPAPPPQQRDAHPAADAAELGSEAAALLRQFGRPNVQAALVHPSAGATKPPDVMPAAPAAPPDDARAVAAGRGGAANGFDRDDDGFGCLSHHIGSTSGVPQIAADLSHRPTRQP